MQDSNRPNPAKVAAEGSGNAIVNPPDNATPAAMSHLALHPTVVPGNLALRLTIDFATPRDCNFTMAFSGNGTQPVRILAYTEMPAAPDQGAYLEDTFSPTFNIQHGTTHASDEVLVPPLESLGFAWTWSHTTDSIHLKATGTFSVTILATDLGGTPQEPLAIDLACDGDFVLRSIEASRRVAAWRESRPDEGTGSGVAPFPIVPDISVARGHRWSFDVGGSTTLVRMVTPASPESPGVEDWQATFVAQDATVVWDEAAPLGPWGKMYAHDLHGPTVGLTLDRLAVGRSFLHGIMGSVDPLPDLAALESLLAS